MTAVRLGLMLERSRIAELPIFWPWTTGRRVRRLCGLPVVYCGDAFQPRRAMQARRAT